MVNVLVRDATKCPESGSTVRTFTPHVLPMTVDMLHGDTQPQLGFEQQLMTGQTQRNIRACLYHSHTCEFCGVVGMDFSPSIRKMRLSGDNWEELY